MNPIEGCEQIPTSAPTLDKVSKSKSKKIFKYKDLWFYYTDTKSLNISVYSIDLGVRIFHLVKTKNQMMCLIDVHYREIEEVINGLGI